MFCPSCLSPNSPNAQLCGSCEADLEGLPRRVSVGAQFLFVDASPRQPVALAIDGGEPQAYSAPLIVSRHSHEVTLGNVFVQPMGNEAGREPLPVDLPRLAAPAGPELAAVITDRKIYRPREEAHVFIVAPDLPSGSVEMEVQLAGQQISKDRVELDEAGTALRPLADLEEGEYTVLIRRQADAPHDKLRSALGRGRLAPEPAGQPVQCTFSVAEFSLSPLVARLEQHRYDPASGELAFRLYLMALSVPYSGAVELGLQCAESGNRVVATQRAEARDGLVDGAFDVRAFGGPFRIQVTTPGGETATVYLPGSAKAERERITLCPLGRVAEAGLLPGEGTQEVRGLHVSYDGEERTPLRLESVVGETGRLVAMQPAAVVQIVTIQPLSGKVETHEFRDVQAGATLEFPVEAPYTLFMAGQISMRWVYEAWGVVVRPVELAAGLLAPGTALPGAEIAVRVEAERPAVCLLLVYDARLEHESPRPKLARQMIAALRRDTGRLKEGGVPSLAILPTGYDGWYGPEGPAFGGEPKGMPVGRVLPLGVRTMAARAAPAGKFVYEPAPIVEGLPDAVEAEPLMWVAVPSREDFPELAYLELFPVRGVAERTVRLGDQIGAWRCRAYLVAGLDVEELTADVAVAKPLYAELDVPAIAGQGDDVLAGVRYHSSGPATLTISLPDGRTVSGAVMGHGLESFHLAAPGEIRVHLAGADGEDWTARTVAPPGVQAVTASRLEILKRGETLSGERVVVYPGPEEVLKDTIEALGLYPFG